MRKRSEPAGMSAGFFIGWGASQAADLAVISSTVPSAF